MHHLRPDLQIDAHIRGPGDLGQPDCVVEQGLGRTDLDQQWCQTAQLGLDRRRQRRARVSAV